MAGPVSYEGVALTTPVSLGYARHTARSTQWYLARLLKECLERTGLAKTDIDGLALASFTLPPDGAAAMTEQLGLSLRFLEDIHLGGTSAIIALRRAARAVQAGEADIVACLAADNMGKGDFNALIANFSGFARDAMHPHGAAGPNAVFAMITQAFMAERGARREDFGKLCLAQRAHAAANPLALLRRPLTMEAYLAARPIAEPLHLLDCVMPCAGGEAFLVMSGTRARRLGLGHVTIAAAVERHDAMGDEDIQRRGGWALDVDELYAQAAIGPSEIAFLQAYDDYPVVVLWQIENLGLAPAGDALAFVRETSLEVGGGGLAINTSGGQLSVGQAGAAGGFLPLVEGIRQLTGETLGRRVEGARFGMVAGFGMVNYLKGVTSGAAILAAGASP